MESTLWKNFSLEIDTSAYIQPIATKISLFEHSLKFEKKNNSLELIIDVKNSETGCEIPCIVMLTLDNITYSDHYDIRKSDDIEEIKIILDMYFLL